MAGARRWAFSRWRRSFAFHELGEHPGAEELEALHDVLVAVLAGLAAEDHLVDATFLVAPEVVTDLVGRADGAAQTEEAALLHDLGAEPVAVARGGLHRLRHVPTVAALHAVLGPRVGGARVMTTEHVIVRERVAEEVRALQSSAQRLLLVVMAHERGHAGDVGVHRITDRDTLGSERVVVVGHPVTRFLGINERERERTDPLLRREVDGVTPAAHDPDRRVRLLHRLRYDVARRHRDVLAGVSGEGSLGETPQRDAQTFLPHRPFVGGVDEEPTEFGLRRRLTGAELRAPSGDEIEHGDPFRDHRAG